MVDTPFRISDVLAGLAPALGASCPRCGIRTSAFANGRGRLDFCAPCGTIDVANPEGLSLFSMKDLNLDGGFRVPVYRQVPEEKKRPKA